MVVASHVLTGLVAALHVWFLVLEMFLWTTPFGQKTFKRSAAEQESTKILAANQGLYNGFLAAGLVWSLVAARRSRCRFASSSSRAWSLPAFTARRPLQSRSCSCRR